MQNLLIICTYSHLVSHGVGGGNGGGGNGGGGVGGGGGVLVVN